MINAIIREAAICGALGQLLELDHYTEIDGLLTEEEADRLYAIIESVPDNDENDALFKQVAYQLLRESIDRLLALEVTQPAAETGN